MSCYLTQDIKQAIDALLRGEVVALPTETVYGLAADITQPAAVQRVFALKKRPADHPLIVHIADEGDLAQIARHIPSYVWLLTRAFWPGPLSIVLPRASHVSDLVTAQQATVAIRCPNHPLMLAVLQGAGRPLAAPSANRFTQLSPTSAQHVQDQFCDESLMILDGGPCQVGLESTIVAALAPDRMAVLRRGVIDAKKLAAVAKVPCHYESHSSIRVAGQHAKHYAPRLPLWLYEQAQRAALLASLDGQECVVTFGDKALPSASRHLSLPTSPKRCAQQLYAILHHADHSGARRVLLELPPNKPAWSAIRDRLLRAGKLALIAR